MKLLVFCFCLVTVFCRITDAQMSPAVLIQRLRNRDTMQSAEIQLEALGSSDEKVRSELSAKLPNLLTYGEPRDQLATVAKLAGRLRLASTVPQLGRLLEKPTEDLLSTDIYRYMSLQNDPFSQALVEIGSPAIPELSRLLDAAKDATRSRAARALMKMNTTTTRAVLKKHIGSETDAGIKSMIVGYLNLEAVGPKAL